MLIKLRCPLWHDSSGKTAQSEAMRAFSVLPFPTTFRIHYRSVSDGIIRYQEVN